MPKDFSPAERRLSFRQSSPRRARRRAARHPLGQAARLDRRALAAPLPDAALERPADRRARRRRPVRDPPRRGGRELARRPLTIDTTAPADQPQGAQPRPPLRRGRQLLTTISPNGDGLRDVAKLRFTLTERAQGQFEVTRTISRPTPIYELTATLPPGRNAFTWFPQKDIGARTYLLRITAVDGAGNRARTAPPTRCWAAARYAGDPRARRRGRLHPSRTPPGRRRSSRSRPTRRRSRCRSSAPARRSAHAQRHDHDRRPREQRSDDPLAGAAPGGDPQLGDRRRGDPACTSRR